MLIDSDVYRNEALSVRSPLNVPRHFFHRPAGTLRVLVFFWQTGGGLFIGGTATLTNTNVYDNQAGGVCSPFELP